MKKFTAFILAALMCATISIPSLAAGGLDSFVKVRSYSTGLFSDVQEGDWYEKSVISAYEQGLMNGAGGGLFSPDGGITLTQAIALAARLHSIYHTGEDNFLQGRVWYDVYVRYALQNGIISSRFGCKAAATRAQFADILSRALPEEALKPINTVDDDAIPDVRSDDEYAEGIYKLYRAGVTTGGDDRGRFSPESGISRAEAAAIITRMTDKSLRKRITLEYAGPELSEREAMGDDFFEDAAFLGNSLVDGLRMYAKLSSAHFFCGTSMTVISATQTQNLTLSTGAAATPLKALTEQQHGKIYIELGINEIGYEASYFSKIYGDMLEQIISAEPDADIYIMSLLPVTKEKSDSSSVFNMKNVNKYNDALRELARDKQCYYLDVCAALSGSDGYLPGDWSSDGVHLYPNYYSVWEACIRTHYA